MPRVLIVDDHAFVRRGVQTLLRPFSEWELCGEANNGNDAIRVAEELRPDVIIMDVAMPRLNGIEATRAIRKTQPGVKIVLLTLYTVSRRATRFIVVPLPVSSYGVSRVEVVYGSCDIFPSLKFRRTDGFGFDRRFKWK